MKPYIFATLIFVLPAVCYAAEDVGGTTLQNLSATMNIVKLKDDLEVKAQRREALKQEIARQIAEAKEKSAKVLSAEELAKIKAQADAVIEKAKREVEEIEADLKAGALVICSSQTIKEVDK